MTEIFLRGATLSLLAVGMLANVVQADEGAVRFDLAPVAEARVESPEESLGAAVPLTFELKLSSMIVAPKTPRVDQWLVQVIPRDRSLLVVDYDPKTTTVSDSIGPVSVKRIDEKSDAIGLSIDGSYGHAARGKAGADRGRKSSESIEFQRHAEVQTVTAAGTIDRGRGVYFKLRDLQQQVLEGEKTFRITLAASPHWRGGLVDVAVVASAERKGFGGFERDAETLGKAHFTVALYRADDQQARQCAHELARCEDQLRRLARNTATRPSVHSLSGLMHVVAMTFDSDATPSAPASIDRLIRGTADPHGDRELRKLPMNVRVAALEYARRRDQLQSLHRKPEPETSQADSPTNPFDT